MGCDIHWVVEQKIRNKWIGIATSEGVVRMPLRINYDTPVTNNYYYVHTDRNYRFFAKLAGVRGDGPDPKGFPAGVSQLSKAMLDDTDLHSISWDYLMDFHNKFLESNEEAAAEFVRRTITDNPNDNLHPMRWMGDGENPKDFRVVYGFDN